MVIDQATFDLGQEVFVVTKDGAIIRTFISAVGKDGAYRIAYRTGWFGSIEASNCFVTFEDAVPHAQAALQRLEQELKDKLADLKKQQQALVDGTRKNLVQTEPVQLHRLEDASKIDMLESIPEPEDYPDLGTFVFGIVTPDVRPRGNSLVHRWEDSYVQEFVVIGLDLTRTGKVIWRLATEPWLDDECEEAYGLFITWKLADAKLQLLVRQHTTVKV